MIFVSSVRRPILLTMVLACLWASSLPTRADETREICRIRITNAVDGLVQVSLDHGDSYANVGRVTHPATCCTLGFAACAYAQVGRVAAVAVHALRVKAGAVQTRDGEAPQVFSIIPLEFYAPRSDFVTEIAGASGIYTDIPAGTSIFRNLSPLVGNPVFLEARGGLLPLPSGYTPTRGDTLVIVCEVFERRPTEIVIENKAGGTVDAVYSDGSEIIATVEHPVRGIGRFDATEYTGVGQINTNHPGVVTVSTAPFSKKLNNDSVETRGGFQILPSRHAVRIGYIPQYMVVAPPSPGAPWLEGAPLLFSGYIGLAYDSDSEANSFMVDIRTGDTLWKPLSALIGRRDTILTRLPGCDLPVSHIRIRFPAYEPDWLEKQFRVAADAYLRSKYGNKPPSQGVVSFAMSGDVDSVRFASLYVDSQFKGISNNAPYAFNVDTSKLPPGEHCVEISGTDAVGVPVKSVRQWFYTVSQSGDVSR